MQIMLVEVHIKPERRADFLAAISDDAFHSENDEPGCLRFDVLQDTEDENKYYYYEVYRDEEARLAHRQTPHFLKYAELSADLFDRDVVRNLLTNVIPQDKDWR